MNLTQILSHFGCGDGNGNTSSTRLVLLAVVAVILIEHVYLTLHTGVAAVFTPDQLEFFGAAFGAKLIQNQQENVQPKQP